MQAGRWRSHVLALVGYVLITAVFSWPLPIHLATHLTGVPEGDTGVYVWNQWVFRHELVEQGRQPYQTGTLFGPGSPANLSLHNYTTFQNLVALPLIPLVGVVASFNLVYLLMTVLTGYCTFLLARRVTGTLPEAWLAGVLFAWSPALVARGTAHFSLVAAAPLALFLLLLVRATDRYRLRDAIGLGVAMWWAASTDVYYAVYCTLMAAVVLAGQLCALRRAPQPARQVLRRTLDAILIALVALIAAVIVSGGWEFTLFDRPVRVRTLYTPMLVLTVVASWRLALRYRLSIAPVTAAQAWALVRFAAPAVLVAVVLLSPVLLAAAQRLIAGDFDTPRIFWRSSPSGIDPLTLLLPNPNHPLVPAGFTAWLRQHRLDEAERVVALPWVALLTMTAAAWAGWAAPRRWLGLTLAFGLLALGPFVVIAGANTHVPGPWALLRYLPVIGLARSPGRFSVVLALAVAVLFAMALTWLASRHPARRRLLVSVGGALLLFELLPAPRPLYSAAVPAIYRQVAAAPAGAGLLEIPFGIRDGTYSVGNFSARTQFYQTAHGKTVMGGYVSRMAHRRVSELRADPVLNALAILSENATLSPEQERALVDLGPGLLVRENVHFVVVDRQRASPALRDLAIRALRLQLVEREGALELYRPGRPAAPAAAPAVVNGPTGRVRRARATPAS